MVDLPILIILAYRPPELRELGVSFNHFPNFEEIKLTHLSAEETVELIQLKLNQDGKTHAQFSDALFQRVGELAQGNPFYIEELINYLISRQLDPNDKSALEELDFPQNLQSLILSRIDQLNESQKITLKVASVIGRIFKFDMLWGAYPDLGESNNIKRDLDILTYLELTARDTLEADYTCFFKHILTHEVAYESLPYATRATLHGQLGQYIEQTYQASLEQYIDQLAYHYERSENETKKRQYLRQAGEMAQARYANDAAINYYRQLLPFVEGQEKIEVMLKLGVVLQLVGRWDEVDDLYQKPYS